MTSRLYFSSIIRLYIMKSGRLFSFFGPIVLSSTAPTASSSNRRIVEPTPLRNEGLKRAGGAPPEEEPAGGPRQAVSVGAALCE